MKSLFCVVGLVLTALPARANDDWTHLPTSVGVPVSLRKTGNIVELTSPKIAFAGPWGFAVVAAKAQGRSIGPVVITGTVYYRQPDAKYERATSSAGGASVQSTFGTRRVLGCTRSRNCIYSQDFLLSPDWTQRQVQDATGVFHIRLQGANVPTREIAVPIRYLRAIEEALKTAHRRRG